MPISSEKCDGCNEYVIFTQSRIFSKPDWCKPEHQACLVKLEEFMKKAIRDQMEANKFSQS